MAPRIRAQTIGGGLGITPTSVAFYDVLSAGGTIAQMAVGGGLTGTWALINSSSSLVALSAGGLMTRGAGAATSGTPVVQFTSGSTILQVPITATVIVATLPANTVLPAISPSGTPVVGVTLTATTGTWTGDPTPTYAYQWRQVDTSTNISGATSATYTPVSGDVGHTLTCVVTATNIKGSASASAATTPAVISVPVAPVNTVAPGAPTGSANVGATLTAQNGTWTGNPSPTFTYVWLVNGVANGATGSTYVPVSGDLGSVISVRVTGTNVAGSASATSAATAAITIAPSIPSNTVAPGVPTGTPSVGNVLTAQNGTWAGYPAPTFTYQWQRNGTNISGATASTYTLVTADAGNPIRVVVTGTNASGSASANSTATPNVTMAPANTVAPTLSTTTPNVGAAVTCSPGTWTGYATPTFAYQWFWADAVTPISGATSSTYTPISGDVGHTLSCNVTGTNSVSSASASTAATGSAVTATTPAYMMIFAGQSNANAEGTGYPPTVAPTDYVSDANIKIWDGSTNAWVTYTPLTNSQGQTSTTGQGGFAQWWGSEWQFAKRWRLDNPSGTIYLVKHVYGGTGLDPATGGGTLNWYPTTSASLYSQLKTKVTNAKANLVAAGKSVTVVGLAWTQGETPDPGNSYVNNYAANLTNFIAAARTDMIGTAPFLISGLSKPSPMFNGGNVHYPSQTQFNAQYTAAAASQPAVVIETIDISNNFPDQFHYQPTDIQKLGAKMYQAALAPTVWGFADKFDAATSATVTSSTLTVANVLSTLPVTVSGCQWSKNGGSYSSSAGTVTTGDTVSIQATASASAFTTTTPTITIGNATYTWNITTMPAVGSGLDGTEADGTDMLGSADLRNLVSYFDGWKPTAAQFMYNRVIAPDGTLSATAVEMIDSSWDPGYTQYGSYLCGPFLQGVNRDINTTTAKFSFYAKQVPGGHRYLQFRVEDAGGAGTVLYLYIDLQTMTQTDSGMNAAATSDSESIGPAVFTAAKYGWTKIEIPFKGKNTDPGYSAPNIFLSASLEGTLAAMTSAGHVNATYTPYFARTAKPVAYLWRAKMYR